MDFQTQLVEAIAAFASELNDGTLPSAREREVVSFFAFGPLSAVVAPHRPLRSARQIGIEVAVPQRQSTTDESHKEFVCKDLVIWHSPNSSTWGADGEQRAFPLAVIEWKTSVSQAGERAAAKDCRTLADWLRETGDRSEAYSVLVTGRTGPRRVTVRRISQSAAPVLIYDSGAAGA